MKNLFFFIFAISFLSHAVAAEEPRSNIPPENQAAVDTIIADFQQQCDLEQGYFWPEDELNYTPPKGVLTLDDDSIYQLKITPDGKMATVLIPEFHCTNVGYGWCGTGGCGFFIIVDGTPYRRLVSHAPRSITVPTYIGEQVLLVYPLHGGGCELANDQSTSGVDPCYSLTLWDEKNQTFSSPDGAISEWSRLLP